LPTGVDDAGQHGNGARALGIARAVADAPGDDPMAQGALGEVMPRPWLCRAAT
jgi:hypothetical protein